MGERMNGGAVMDERSPEMLARLQEQEGDQVWGVSTGNVGRWGGWGVAI